MVVPAIRYLPFLGGGGVVIVLFSVFLTHMTWRRRAWKEIVAR